MAILPLLRRSILAASLALAPVAAAAQSPFDTVARVNDGVVTRFEVEQRELFLNVLSILAADREVALESLIEDRLKLDAAATAGILPTTDELEFAMENFAGRANVSKEEFVAAIADVGIQEQTFRDYVRALLAWGDVVRERFASRARPTEEEVDRAMALGTGDRSTQVKLAEIVLPMNPQVAEINEVRAEAFQKMTSFSQFSNAARQYSVSPSRVNGGEMPWRPLSELPPQIAPLFLSMQPGEVTEPLMTNGGLVLFQFRALQDARPSLTGNVTLDFIRVALPLGTSPTAEIARIRPEVDRCEDLYGVYFNGPPEQLQRTTEARAKVPGDITRTLDILDEGEMAPLGSGIVMLCARTGIPNEDLSREDVQVQLLARRLDSYGESYLEELRADAFIEIVR
ncbi:MULTISPECIES: peptidylprolyl isomerase [unclassified Meridianimarinicoccus]|uniref:peptidylprolyl isomerase n=1 Tax=unclassified Meridianimarinicoccus TaxID=2923344 RepID=UPI00186834D9|nr:peptidylprolyl isomerase [Fluviibacterium sp. MJW13]